MEKHLEKPTPESKGVNNGEPKPAKPSAKAKIAKNKVKVSKTTAKKTKAVKTVKKKAPQKRRPSSKRQTASQTTKKVAKKVQISPKEILLAHITPRLVYIASAFVDVQDELPDFEPMELGALGRRHREFFDDDLIEEAVEAAQEYPKSSRLFEIGRYAQHKGQRNLAKTIFVSGILAKQSAAKCWDHLAQMIFDEKNLQGVVAFYDYMLEHEKANFFQTWQAALANAAVGRPQKTVKLVTACEKLAKRKLEKQRLLPLLALKAYASKKPMVLRKLLQTHKGSFVKPLPQWLRTRINTAAQNLVPSVIGISPTRVHGMIEDLQTGLETSFDSPQYWEDMADNNPDSVAIVSSYLDKCLRASGKGVKSELLSVYQSSAKLNIDELEVAIGSYLHLKFVDDAHFVLMKQKLKSSEITEFFERIIQRFGDSEALLDLVDRTRSQYPNNLEFAILNGQLAARLGQQKRAEECLWPVFDKQPELLDYPERLQLAIALQMSNKPNEALEVIENIAEDTPEWERASAVKSRIAYQIGKFDHSILASHDRLRHEFENRDDLKDLCFAYRASGQHGEAFFVAEELFTSARGHEESYMQALGLMATEAALSGDRENIDLALHALNSDPRIQFSGWTRTWVFISMYLMLGDVQSAHRLADNFYQKNPTNQIAILTAEWLRNYAGDRSSVDLSDKIIDMHERESMKALRVSEDIEFANKPVSDFSLCDLVDGPRVTIVVP
ncbi:MAG TPA: hypothetical protein ENK06_09155, partial [Gammaproteobacteria bacterium]|nr:hypothetical protein [Gammaproteobacteria bacterium]